MRGRKGARRKGSKKEREHEGEGARRREREIVSVLPRYQKPLSGSIQESSEEGKNDDSLRYGADNSVKHICK